jgi:hypothetical protein
MAVLDSGAGKWYILTSNPERFPLVITSYKVHLADETPLSVTSQFVGLMRVVNDQIVDSIKFKLGLIVCSGRDRIILGRDLASLLDISVNYREGRVWCGSALICSSGSYRVSLVETLDSRANSDKEETLLHLHPDPALKSITATKIPSEKAVVTKVIDDLTAYEVQLSVYCRGLQVGFRRFISKE